MDICPDNRKVPSGTALFRMSNSAKAEEWYRALEPGWNEIRRVVLSGVAMEESTDQDDSERARIRVNDLPLLSCGNSYALIVYMTLSHYNVVSCYVSQSPHELPPNHEDCKRHHDAPKNCLSGTQGASPTGRGFDVSIAERCERDDAEIQSPAKTKGPC